MTSPKDQSTIYDGPPDYRLIGQHEVFPETSHDEMERFNFLAQMNNYLSSTLLPAVKEAFDDHVESDFIAANKREFKDRHEIQDLIKHEPAWQWWSALRRATMETRQQAGRWVSLRQSETLNAKVAELTKDDPRLQLAKNFNLPRGTEMIDHHCMPGSYHTENYVGDITAAANYDAGIFVTTGGFLGRFTDGAGMAIANFVKQTFGENFKPKRILDIGAGLGHNVLPLALAFPDAEVIAVDTAAPMLRYGLARAKALGVENVKFVQADAADLSQFEDESFDWIQSTMFLHETCFISMPQIFKETNRLLKPGGIVLHAEQPQYAPTMPLYEQAMRDWDAFYNNEPFWSKMHEVDLDAWLQEAGFSSNELIHAGVSAWADKDLFPEADNEEEEDFGRKAAWHVVGAKKAG